MKKVLTSVKIDKDAYTQFKDFNINRKFYLQDLVNRSIHLYLNDESFRDTVCNYNISPLSIESQDTQLPSLQNNTESIS